MIIADDLTGACDTALQFRRRGARSLVHLAWDAPPNETDEVEAFSTGSRNLEAQEAVKRIREIATHITSRAGGTKLIFKKIDSLLRGNPGPEIIATMEAFACDITVITPAFPDLGRTVADGLLHVAGDANWTAMDVLAVLRGQGLEGCHHVSPDAIARTVAVGVKHVSADGTSTEQLRMIVSEAMTCGRKILWVGSGGLACALADIMLPEAPPRVQRPRGGRPVVFCIGSQHPVIELQLASLRLQRTIREFPFSANVAPEMQAALAAGQHAVVLVDMASADTHSIRQLFGEVSGFAEAVVISGGDTLDLFCRAMDCSAIEIEDQVVAGIPWGVLHGGLLEGVTVATKSGAFGAPDTLTKVVDFFTCLKN